MKCQQCIYQKVSIVLFSFKIKSSLLVAIVGVVIGLVAFIVNYNFIEFTFPGYQVITVPARFALSFFSEETAFWPKMVIFLLGQFVGYFILGDILNRVLLVIKSK